MPAQYEDNHEFEIEHGNDEVSLYIPRNHVLEDLHSVKDQQNEHQYPIEPQQRTHEVVPLREFFIVLVEVQAQKQHSKQCNDIHEVDYIRDARADSLHIQNPENKFAELPLIRCLEKALEGRHDVFFYGGGDGHLHRNVENRKGDVCDFLNEPVIRELEVETEGPSFAAVVHHVLEGEPAAVYPPAPLAQHFGKGGHRIDCGLCVRQVG